MSHSLFARQPHGRAGRRTALVALLTLASPALADLPGRALKPTLLVAPEPGDAVAHIRNRSGTDAKAVAAGGHVVSLATRDFDVGKLDANAFGDGEDVKR